jgi:hypothetical protein
MKFALVNGTNFEVMNTRIAPYGKSDIFELYQRPSVTKIDIFRKWLQFFRKVGTINIVRVHGNCMTFVIVADVIGKDGQRYNFYITKAHNRVYCY